MHRNDKVELNILSLLICAAVMYLTAVRRVTNPACGMQINGANTVRRDLAGETGEPGIRNAWRYSTSTRASMIDASRGRRSRFRAFSVQRGVDPERAGLLSNRLVAGR
jgi:hypothetical protein